MEDCPYARPDRLHHRRAFIFDKIPCWSRLRMYPTFLEITVLAPSQDGQSEEDWMHIQDISSCDYATSSFPHRYKSDIAKTINKRNKFRCAPLLLKMTATIDILITYRLGCPSSHAHQFGSPDVPGRIVISDQTEDSDPVGLASSGCAACPPCSRSYHRYPQTSAPPWYSGTAPVLLEQAQVSTRSWTTNSGTRCS